MNPDEYLLHQILILLNAYGEDKRYSDEVEKLNDERKQILERLQAI